MGTCCSKIKSKDKCASFNGVQLRPSSEQWQAQSTCQFCQLNEVAGHVQGCICGGACQGSARYAAKGSIKGGSHHDRPRCSLCVADAYEAELDRALRSSHSRSGDLTDGNEMTHCGLAENDCVTKHNEGSYHHHFPLMDNHQILSEPDDEMLPSSRSLASSGNEGQDVVMFSNIATHEISSTLMRSTHSFNIDDSDGIKLEVRYKHMLPHDVQRGSVTYVPPHEDHVLKRIRSSEKLLAGDPEANRSVRRRKSFEVDSADLDLRCRHGEATEPCKLDEDDNIDDDDEFHDITVGVSINSLRSEAGYMQMGSPGDSEQDIGMHPFHQSHDKIPMVMNNQGQNGSNYVVNCVGVLNPDVSEFNQPMYMLSKENMQFICREERVWEVRTEAMGMEEKMSKMQALSVVSTGDAILFSGADSDEFHLIPSVFVQHPQSPMSSPLQNLSHPRSMTSETDTPELEKSSLSIEDIILLLENDKLSEDDLFSLLIDSCTKSSPSMSPTSPSSESSMIWSSPLSPSSLSSSASTSTLTSSALLSKPWLPSSSTSMLQLPPSSKAYSLSPPYSLSLPASCKMSPHTAFEFEVKSCSSTPLTPVFSPIRSRAKRNIAQMKPNALTIGEIAEIWGIFEQRQAFVTKKCS